MSDKKKPQLIQIICELAPKLLGVQLAGVAILGGPLILGRLYGDGWGLSAVIVSIVVWLYFGKKFWFYSTIRWVWLIGLVWLVLFAIFELLHLFR